MATYYVAEGGTAANKAAATSGTYPGGCMSVSVHNGETFSADDFVVIVADGGVIRRSMNGVSSGTDGHPLTYTFESDVVMSGGEFLTGWTLYSGDIWEASTSGWSYNEVKDLFFNEAQGAKQTSIVACVDEGDWYWASDVVYLCATGDPDTTYTDPGVEVVVRPSPVSFMDRNYIVFDGNGCEIKYSTSNGIYLKNSTGSIIKDFVTHDFLYGIQDSVFGIRTQNCQSLTIQRVTSYRAGWNGFSIGALFDTSESLTDYLIEDCLAYENSHNGFDFVTLPSGSTLRNLTIQHCRARDNGQNGFYIRAPGSAYGAIHDVVCKYNLAHDNGRVGISFDAIDGGAYHDNCVIIGNTCVRNSAASGSYGGGMQANCTGSIIKNNICAENNVAEEQVQEIAVNDGGGDANVMDYNLVYHPTNTNIYYWDGTFYTAANIYSSTGQQEHGIHTSPLCTDLDNGDLTLTSDSPCIGAAENLGTSYADALLPASTWPSGVLVGDQDDY